MRPSRILLVAGVAAVVFVIDRVTKAWVSENIPLGTAHRLENPGKIPLALIEVQSGAYLGEDDIVRLDDVYNRTSDD